MFIKSQQPWSPAQDLYKIKPVIRGRVRSTPPQLRNQSQSTAAGEGSVYFKVWLLVSSKFQSVAPHPRVCGQCKLTSETEVGKGIKLGVSRIWDTSGRS